MSENPLQKLYRHKKVYISLPSQGRFYKSGIKLSADSEIGIQPMTASDEIKLKTPDSLFNGEALYELFKSCVPDIVEPREIPVCDIDKLLLGIRLASSGSTLDIMATCPKCKTKEEYTVDLTVIMNSAQPITKENIVELDNNVVVEVRPLTLKNQIMAQVDTFYQYRMQQMLNDENVSVTERSEQFNELLVQAITLQTGQIADAIISVQIEDVLVTDPEHIFEWVENMDNQTHKKIKKCIETLSDNKMNTNSNIQCQNPKCNHKYSTVVDLNPVNFF